MGLVNTPVYYWATYYLLNPNYHLWLAPIAAAIAAAHVGCAIGAFKRTRQGEDATHAVWLALGLAIAFAGIASWCQWDGHWVTIAWAGEAAAVALLALAWGSSRGMVAAGLVLIVTIGKLLGLDVEWGALDLSGPAFANLRTLAFLSTAGAAAVLAVSCQQLGKKEGEAAAGFGVLALTELLLCALLWLELDGPWPKPAIAWTGFVFLFIGRTMVSRPVRLCSWAVVLFAACAILWNAEIGTTRTSALPFMNPRGASLLWTAAAALVCAWLARRPREGVSEGEAVLPRVAFAVGNVVIFVALGVELSPWAVAIAWTIQAGVLGILGERFSLRELHAMGLAMYAGALWRVLFYDPSHVASGPIALVNARSAAFLGTTAVSFLITYLEERWREKLAWRHASLGRFSAIGGNLVLMALFGLELEQRWVVIARATQAFGMWLAGMYWGTRDLRPASAVLAALTLGRALGTDSRIASDAFRVIANARFGEYLYLAALLFGTPVLYRRFGRAGEKEREIAAPILMVAATLVVLIALSLEAHSFYRTERYAATLGAIDRGMAEQLTYSALWAIGAAVVLIAGFYRRNVVLRVEAIVILLAVVAKVLLYDLRGLGQMYRVLSFFCLGLVLLGASLLYNKYKDKLLAGATAETGEEG